MEPGAAAQHALAAIAARRPGPTVRRRTVIAVVPAILDPFPHIAVQVVQPEAVRRKRACGRRLLTVPAAAATVCYSARLLQADQRLNLLIWIESWGSKFAA